MRDAAARAIPAMTVLATQLETERAAFDVLARDLDDRIEAGADIVRRARGRLYRGRRRERRPRVARVEVAPGIHVVRAYDAGAAAEIVAAASASPDDGRRY